MTARVLANVTELSDSCDEQHRPVFLQFKSLTLHYREVVTRLFRSELNPRGETRLRPRIETVEPFMTVREKET